MINHGKHVLGRALERARDPFGINNSDVPKVSDLPAAQAPVEPRTPGCLDTLISRNLPEDPSAQGTASPRPCMTAPERLPPMKMDARLDTTEEIQNQNQTSVETCKDVLDLRTLRYASGPNRIVAVSDGGRECMAFLLTEETVSGLRGVFKQREEVGRLTHHYQQAKHKADVGQGWLDYVPVILKGATSVKEYDQLNQDLERRKPEILNDVERKEELEHELRSKTQELELSKEIVDDAFEQLLSGLETVGSESGEDSSPKEDKQTAEHPKQADSPAQEDSTIEEDENLDILDEIKLSRQILLEIQFAFDQQRDIHELEEAEFFQLEQDGHGETSKSELDRSQFQQRADTTRALIEAEQAYREIRQMARSLGVLRHNEPDQESDFVDQSEDGSGSCCGTGDEIPESDKHRILGWLQEVNDPHTVKDLEADIDDCDAQSDPLEGTQSEADQNEWDATSVTWSDSASVVARGRGRSRIDSWKYICDTVQDEDGNWNGDAGAMGHALRTGELELS